MFVKEIVEDEKIAMMKMDKAQKRKTPTEDNPKMETAEKKSDEKSWKS